ncbi:MAG TPA: hypothetical protein VMV49_02520 [Candidatus Deferrimicrobium sp.]|nr:hypothetical protein [Candidatus Deferrimicrobium sp.]
MEGYELKELKLRKKGEVLNEIPDEYYAKKFIPLSDNTFTALRLADDWKAYENQYEGFEEMIAKNVQIRLDESIKTSKAVQEGQIKRLKETVCFWGYPPVLPIRMDMQNLSTKMIYGPSTDISFACLSDLDRDLAFILNLHVEETVPEDYWFLLKSDAPEIFDRRHMKLGIRLRDIGKKIKDNIEAARRIREILIDIRNEKTPQWASSTYYVCIFFMVGAANMAIELSNWNALGEIWDGVNAASRYGLHDCIFNYEPLPPILNMMFQLERPYWMDRLTKALMDNQLYFNYLEKEIMESVKKHNYELYDYFIRFFSYQLETGIPAPSVSIQAKQPIYNKETGEWDRIGFEFPEGPRIHYRDLGLTFEEALSGVLLDITHKSNIEKVTRDNLISIGHGLQTKYLRSEP